MSLTELLTVEEGKTLEFKRDLSSPRNLLKTLVAFANTAGGKVIIGVTDHQREIIGISHPLDEEERLCNLIADSILPRLVPNVEIHTVNGRSLLVVEVFLSNSRPHYLRSEGPDAGVYIRLDSTTRQADRQLIAELHRSVSGLSFDEIPMPELSVADLDLDAAQAAFGARRELNEQTLLTLKLLVLHQNRLVPTQGAVLLFGKKRTASFPDVWVQCGRFFGTRKIDIFDHFDIDQPFPQTVDEVMFFLKKHAYRGADLSEVRRKDVWSIPLEILREVIINALVHSDYSQRGAPIRVVFLDNRIEVESMGMLLPGLTVEEMKQGVSRIRNPVIARVFKELGLIEQWGTGVQRIFTEARELGLPEPQIEEIALRLRFTVYLADPRQTERVTERAIPFRTEQETVQLTEQVKRLLPVLQERELSARGAMEALDLKHRPTFLYNYLRPALSSGLIEMNQPDSPNSPTQKYRLSEAGRRMVGKLK